MSENCMTKSFAEQLKNWLGKRYQKEGADALGVPLPTFRAWMAGVCEPRAHPRSMEVIQQKMREHPDK